MNTTVSCAPKTGIKNGTATRAKPNPVTVLNKDAINTLIETKTISSMSVIFYCPQDFPAESSSLLPDESAPDAKDAPGHV